MMKTRWIPVEERLPADGAKVLTLGPVSNIADPRGHVRVAWRRDDGYWVDDNRVYSPTHWHPLPAPPGEPEPTEALPPGVYDMGILGKVRVFPEPPPTDEELDEAAMMLYYAMTAEEDSEPNTGKAVRHLWSLLKRC